MLRGSASPQPSGAPPRGAGGGRGAWPPPAHQPPQPDMFRGYGVYSLFPGPGPGDPGAVYAPKAAHSGAGLQGFLTGQKDSLFSPAFAFGSTAASVGLSPVMPSYTASAEPRLTGELNSPRLQLDTQPARPWGVKAEREGVSEADSTEVGLEKHRGESSICRKSDTSSVVPLEPDSWKHAEPTNDKCNIKVIDLSLEGRKNEKTINEICNRLTERKKAKKCRPLALPPTLGGCSRTTPVTFKPPDLDVSSIKREPFLEGLSPVDVDSLDSKRRVAAVTPCQVAEVTSASSLLSPCAKPLVVKQEVAGASCAEVKKDVFSTPLPPVPPSLPSAVNSTGCNIPVGIAVARQRCHQQQQQHRTVETTPVVDFTADTGAVYTGGVACSDGAANVISWPAPQANPTLWQYSAPIDYPPLPPVGFQLVRDPMTGHFLLIPAANIEALQRAILWPSYTPPQMMLPPLPPTQHLLMDSTLPPDPHRILITADKRKMHSVIKLETSDCSSLVVSCDEKNVLKPQSLSPQPLSEPQPCYRQKEGREAIRRSQATSPVACLSPPPEPPPQNSQSESEETLDSQSGAAVTLQDASNQTEPLPSENRELNIDVEPVVEIKKEMVSPVDTSGLQLLSNSIEQLEGKDDTCEGAVLLQGLKNGFREEGVQFEGGLGGLGLLCALAEQRIKEGDGLEGKQVRSEEVEVDMRLRLAELQRKYREKQKELSKLTPKKSEEESPKRGPGRPKKKSVDGELDMSPPVLEKATELEFQGCLDEVEAAPELKPVLSPSPVESLESLDSQDSQETLEDEPIMKPAPLRLPPCNVQLVKLDLGEVKEERKRKSIEEETPSSSKKRKVGRPKKHLHASGGQVPTETIVAKKPKTKPNFLFTPKPIKPDPDAETPEEPRKIRPKLKAEPKIKEEEPEPEKKKEKLKKSVKGRQTCVLTSEHLECEKLPLRALTAMGGLLYAGQLSALRAPDVYGVTIDGERGSRPHIYSREEILKDSILEVRPTAADVTPGSRLCAYWSQQQRCLYPGTACRPPSPQPEPEPRRFVHVEFDDGDSGRISLEDVRLLPQDYPIVEHDPNPLQSLSRRKRCISAASGDLENHSKEIKVQDNNNEEGEGGFEGKEGLEGLEGEEGRGDKMAVCFVAGSESERRHLKKKRREKLKRLQSLSADGKKKHKKHHKCSEEHRHHRHHKKHRRHRHKHNKRRDGEAETQSEKQGKQGKQGKKCRERSERTESVESRSKMAAFLPARQLWGWAGKGYRRPGAKGRARKEFYKTIQRGKERIAVGDCAVFLSTGRPDRPYIGRIETMWESWCSNMIVKVKWFYHPEETVGCPATLQYPGALFESPHVDENDVQTISHKCEVLPLKEYREKLGNDPQRYETIYDNNDVYYLAGYYDPTITSLTMEPGVK